MTPESSRIRVTARIENLEGQFMAANKVIDPGQVRSLTVDDAMVDSSVVGLVMPSRLIESLSLRRSTVRTMRTPGGAVPVQMHDAVRLTIQERDCVMEVQEIQGDSLILVGRIPLLALDWVIDPSGSCLIGNPEHGGEWMSDAF
jgi:predicted aspartyl protease